MREYGQIQASFWGHPDIISLSDQAKLLAAYLLTGPHSNGLGCYRLPDGYVQSDLGWPSETVSKGFQELFRNGFCKRCERTNFVLIPGFLKWNPIANANVASAREKEFREVPSKFSMFQELADSVLRHGKHLSNGFETLLKGYAKQDPTLPYPERNQKNTCAMPADADMTPHSPAELPPAEDPAAHPKPTHRFDYPPEFERTWQAYPRRAGGNSKAEAFKAWKARRRAGASAEEIHAGVLRYAAYVDATGKSGTEYVKQAATFFGPAEHYREAWHEAKPDWMRTAV